MNKLSVVIITLNEARTIERCIESVGLIADEVLVIDSGSTDETEAICRRHGVRFVQREWDSYSGQKNYGNSLAEFDFILSLDADEELSPMLVESIRRAKADRKADVYFFNRLNFFCGKAIKNCGWYPNRQYRLFDRRQTHWNGALVHELLDLKPDLRLGFLQGDLLHYTCEEKEEYTARQEHYAALRASELAKRSERHYTLTIALMAAFRFFRTYIVQLGFLEGATGLFLSRCSAQTVFRKYSWVKKCQLSTDN